MESIKIDSTHFCVCCLLFLFGEYKGGGEHKVTHMETKGGVFERGARAGRCFVRFHLASDLGVGNDGSEVIGAGARMGPTTYTCVYVLSKHLFPTR